MKRCVFIILVSLSFVHGWGQTVQDIIADVYEQLAEDGGVDMEQLTQELLEIHTQPININTATEDDLLQLRFLSSVQIDNILNYVQKHPMASIYELQLVPGLREYEIRNLMYFLKVEQPNLRTPIYAKEVFHYANHELTLRMDARNIENNGQDPFYGNLRYRFNYHNQVQAGITIQRSPHDKWKEIDYGGYIQLKNITPHLKTLVLGNFEGQFGLGLVMGQSNHMGKSSYILSSANGAEGVRKYGSVSPSYDYLHGIATTLTLGMADVSLLYSIRAENSNWHHVVGMNTTIHRKNWKVGLTALEDIYSKDSAMTSFGINARYNHGRWDLFGEVAGTYNSAQHFTSKSRWGVGTIVGAKLTPIDGLGFFLLYRYYSPCFQNRYAYAFSESSKVGDENGFYIGSEIRLLPKWRFALYADGFRFADVKYGVPYPSNGFDVMAQADYEINKSMMTYLKFRARRKGINNTYSLRYQYTWNSDGWHLRTQADATFVKPDTMAFTWGASIYQDIQYSFRNVPITLLLRLQCFDIRNWDNRIYTYENDVLYANSIPATYGIGGRWFVNCRYQINQHWGLYLRVSQTIYHPNWSVDHTTKSEVHFLVRGSW